MRVHVPNDRLRRRRSSLLAVAVAIAAMLVAPLSVTANELSEYDVPPTNVYGWVPFDSATVQLIARVRDGVSAKGAYDEWLKSVECTGDGVSGGFPFTGSYRDDTVVYVTIEGPTGPSGVQVVCTATFWRTYPTSCSIIFGVEICNPPRQDPDEVTAVYSDTFRLDGTAPATVTGTPTVQPNAAGWYRNAGFVSFSGTDPQSGIRICSATQAFGGISSASVQGVSGSCENFAGLTRNGSFTYRFDDVVPTLSPTVTPSVVLLNGVAAASANATDAHSGIKSQGCDPVDTSSPGAHAVSCTAIDNADNTQTATATYRVAYGFSGFDQPVDATARNIAKAGRTIPLKWRVTDGTGAPVTGLASVSVSAASLSCAAGTSEDQIEEYASGGSGLRDLGDGYYQFNWSTPKSYAGSCKTLRLDLGDGTMHTATFEFTR